MDIFSCITSNLQRLSHIRRYAALPVHRQETVAEHLFYCTLYSSLIARNLIAEGYTHINHESVLLKALHHDLEEHASNDQIRTYKNTTPELRTEIDRANKIQMKALSHQLGDAYDMTYEVWLNAKDDSIEGQIVNLADQLCLVAYIREEIISGNRHMDPVAQRAHDFIKGASTGLLEKYYAQVYPTGDWKDILRYVPE